METKDIISLICMILGVLSGLYLVYVNLKRVIKKEIEKELAEKSGNSSTFHAVPK